MTGRPIAPAQNYQIFEAAYVAWKRETGFQPGSLTPRYWITWSQVFGGYVVLASCVGLHVWTSGLDSNLAWALCLPVAITIGFIMNFFTNFFHEATHYGLSSIRSRNDVLANLFLGLFLGHNVKNSREIHMGHHRRLGRTDDPENSYFIALDAKYFFSTLFGLRLFRYFRSYFGLEGQRATAVKLERGAGRWNMVGGLLANIGVMAMLWHWGDLACVAAWVLGLLVFSPFWISLRQVVEHWRLDADASVDYFSEDHGATSWIFEDKGLSAVFGSAGFCYHLLHHLEPGVHHSRLPELLKCLEATRLRGALEPFHSTYLQVFLKLSGEGRRRRSLRG